MLMKVYSESFLGVSIIVQAFFTEYKLTGFPLTLEDVNISSLSNNAERNTGYLYFLFT